MSLIDSLSFLLISVTKDQKKNNVGFTLIELMIVIFMIATLSAIAIPVYSNYIDKAKNIRAVAEIRIMEKEIQAYEVENEVLPNTLSDIGRGDFLDPWGNPYQYLKIVADNGNGNGDESRKARRKRKREERKKKRKMRKDRWEVPLNSDYDLYSKGKDGKSRASLRPKVSRDDIVRASDGGYVGLASEYS